MAKKNYSKKKEKDALLEETNSAEKVEVRPIEKIAAHVILATANFYIVDKDGKNYKIVEKNNYKKGDIIEM